MIHLKQVDRPTHNIFYYTGSIQCYGHSSSLLENNMNLSRIDLNFGSFWHHIIQTDRCKKKVSHLKKIKIWCYSNRFMHQIDHLSIKKKVRIQMFLTSIEYNFLLLKPMCIQIILISPLFKQIYIITSAFEERPMQHIDLPKCMRIQMFFYINMTIT